MDARSFLRRLRANPTARALGIVLLCAVCVLSAAALLRTCSREDAPEAPAEQAVERAAAVTDRTAQTDSLASAGLLSALTEQAAREREAGAARLRDLEDAADAARAAFDRAVTDYEAATTNGAAVRLSSTGRALCSSYSHDAGRAGCLPPSPQDSATVRARARAPG